MTAAHKNSTLDVAMTDHVFSFGLPRVRPRALAEASEVHVARFPSPTPLGPLIDRQLAAARRNGTTFVVLRVSLDGFESVGVRYGRTVADQVLHSAWNRLRNRLRTTDVAVRVGHSEFGVVLFDAARPAASMVDARLTEALCQPYGIGALDIVLAVRVGVAIYPQAGATGEALAAAAQNAIATR
jgi:diguanylate cyclase (GGDEF)-like protein